MDGRNNEIFFHNNSIFSPEELNSFVPAIQHGRRANPLYFASMLTDRFITAFFKTRAVHKRNGVCTRDGILSRPWQRTQTNGIVMASESTSNTRFCVVL